MQIPELQLFEIRQNKLIISDKYPHREFTNWICIYELHNTGISMEQGVGGDCKKYE